MHKKWLKDDIVSLEKSLESNPSSAIGHLLMQKGGLL